MQSTSAFFESEPECAAAVEHNAHGPRTPKHGGRYRYGRGHGRHSLLLHRPLIGGEGEGGRVNPTLYSNPVVNVGVVTVGGGLLRVCD